MKLVFSIIINLVLASNIFGQSPPLVSIYDIQYLPPGQDTSSYLGQTVQTGGIVTVDQSIFYGGAGVVFYISDPGGGEWSGITAYLNGYLGIPELSVGDSILFTGEIVEEGYKTSLVVDSGSFEFRMFGLPEPPPAEITASVFDNENSGDSLAIPYEGVFCRIYDLTVDTVVIYGPNSVWSCHDSTGNCLIRECSDSIPNSFRPDIGTRFTYIDGVVDSRFNGFFLQPRYFRDLRLYHSSTDEELPVKFEPLFNYPNPFNASTTIRYLLPSTANVKLEIYDILGRKVETLIDQTEQAGVHSVIWDANDHPSGVYFARLQTDSESKNIKMLMIK